MRYWSLNGITPYEKVRELQLKLVDLRAADRVEDTVLFLEHEPVITQGRGLQFTGASRPRHMPVPVALPPGIQFAESERGGDLTYHGPGQLVIYPICKLDGSGFSPRHDVAAFLREMENLLIRELAFHQKVGSAVEGAAGVWTEGRKIASIGIAVRKWVTYHGLALNCVNDLKPFNLISPCGFSPEVMTNLLALLPPGAAATDLATWRSALEARLAGFFQEQRGVGEVPARVNSLSLEEALVHSSGELI